MLKKRAIENQYMRERFMKNPKIILKWVIFIKKTLFFILYSSYYMHNSKYKYKYK
jgi:hypothetical protein